MDHGRQATLLIRGATSEENATGDDAPKRVVLPVGRVADPNRVDVGVKGQHPWPASEATEHVAHLVEMDIAVSQLLHLPHDPFAREPFTTTRRWDSDEVPEELDAFRGGFLG